MKKAFTLIELIITILLMTIFLNFVFRFYSNVLMEVRYLEAKDSLTYNGFRALQIVKNGVKSNSNYIEGVVTLDIRNNDTNFTSNSGKSVKIDTSDGNLIMTNGSNPYNFRGVDIYSNNFVLKEISNDLYLIEFNATKESILNFSELNETDRTTYQRLVYTR